MRSMRSSNEVDENERERQRSFRQTCLAALAMVARINPLIAVRAFELPEKNGYNLA